MRVLVVTLLVVLALGAGLAAGHAVLSHAGAKPQGRSAIADRLSAISQAISRRDDVRVVCGPTGDPGVLGFVNFYGDRPGNETVIADRLCAVLDRVHRDPAALPSLGCTRLGGGSCPQPVIDLAWAASALAHESFHLGGVRDEAAAECYGLQTTAFVLE